MVVKTAISRHLNEDAEQPEQVMGGLFLQTACGKKSVSLNLAEAEGRDILKKLAATADVIVANMPAKAVRSCSWIGRNYKNSTPKQFLSRKPPMAILGQIRIRVDLTGLRRRNLARCF